jgi:hypothetical protein
VVGQIAWHSAIAGTAMAVAIYKGHFGKRDDRSSFLVPK